VVANDDEQRQVTESRAEQSRVRRARKGRKKGGGAPAVPTREDRAATARGRRRPVVIGAGTLSAVSTVTVW
jgi:hypothetical protein